MSEQTELTPPQPTVNDRILCELEPRQREIAEDLLSILDEEDRELSPADLLLIELLSIE